MRTDIEMIVKTKFVSGLGYSFDNNMIQLQLQQKLAFCYKILLSSQTWRWDAQLVCSQSMLFPIYNKYILEFVMAAK